MADSTNERYTFLVKLSENMFQKFIEQDQCDTLIITKYESLVAHSVVFSSASPRLSVLIKSSSSTVRSHKYELDLTDVDCGPGLLRPLMRYCYTGILQFEDMSSYKEMLVLLKYVGLQIPTEYCVLEEDILKEPQEINLSPNPGSPFTFSQNNVSISSSVSSLQSMENIGNSVCSVPDDLTVFENWGESTMNENENSILKGQVSLQSSFQGNDLLQENFNIATDFQFVPHNKRTTASESIKNERHSIEGSVEPSSPNSPLAKADSFLTRFASRLSQDKREQAQNKNYTRTLKGVIPKDVGLNVQVKANREMRNVTTNSDSVSELVDCILNLKHFKPIKQKANSVDAIRIAVSEKQAVDYDCEDEIILKTDECIEEEPPISKKRKLAVLRCNEVDCTFSTSPAKSEELLEHLRKVHNCLADDIKASYETVINLRFCPVADCDFTTTATKNLKSHMKIHKNIRYFCDICEKEFKSKYSFQRHRDSFHGKECINCDVCGKSFVSKSNLRFHIKYVHEGDKPVMNCDECDFKADNKRKLLTHMWTSHDIQPPPKYPQFKCEECGFKTLQKCTFEIHQKRHKGERSHTCDVCGLSFVTLHELQTHQDAHKTLSDGQYVCEHCSFAFVSSTKLRKHINTKHRNSEDKQFICEVCDYRTNIKGNLNLHLRNTHKMHVETKQPIQPPECVFRRARDTGNGANQRISAKARTRRSKKNVDESKHPRHQGIMLILPKPKNLNVSYTEDHNHSGKGTLNSEHYRKTNEVLQIFSTEPVNMIGTFVGSQGMPSEYSDKMSKTSYLVPTASKFVTARRLVSLPTSEIPVSLIRIDDLQNVFESQDSPAVTIV